MPILKMRLVDRAGIIMTISFSLDLWMYVCVCISM